MYTAVIILQYNNYKDTINCIESLLSHNTSEIKIIVVDNASTNSQAIPALIEKFKEWSDGSYCELNAGDSVTGELSRFNIVVSQRNEGYARGNNIGIKAALEDTTIDSFLILNNDTLIIDDMIPRLSRDIKELQDCGFITPLLLNLKREYDPNCARRQPATSFFLIFSITLGKDIFHQLSGKFIPQSELSSEITRVELISGSCMMCSRKVMAKLDGFDPNTFLYCEENIMSDRLAALGLSCYVDSRVRCIHIGQQSTSSTTSDFLLRASSQSLLYYARHYRRVPAVLIAICRALSYTTRQMLKVWKKLR